MVASEEEAQQPKLEKEDTFKPAAKTVKKPEETAAKEVRQQDTVAAVKLSEETAVKETRQQDMIAAINMPEQQGAQLQGKHIPEQLWMQKHEDMLAFAAFDLIYENKMLATFIIGDPTTQCARDQYALL